MCWRWRCSDSLLSGNLAWLLLEAGASDVFAWNHSATPAAEIAARFERWGEIDRLIHSDAVQEQLVGQSSSWITTLRGVVEVAQFTNASVLILGESGAGKELIARLIHKLDKRPNKGELVIVDCTTIVPELSGSEFFGHERGAFTGAIAAREGAFALANGGTLFLDEVGELPSGLQAELLRVVQERTYKPVGSNVWRRTDFRLVCATNRDLVQDERRGKFRKDFYSRIAGWTCHIPPLRQRPDDIIPLARFFMRKLQPDTDPPEFDDTVRDYLIERDYPANVRDLKQLVAQMFYRHVGPGRLTVGDVPADERPEVESEKRDWRDGSFERAIRRAIECGIGLKEIGRAAEDVAKQIAIADEKGNLQRAARKLGVTDRALQMHEALRRSKILAGNVRTG